MTDKNLGRFLAAVLGTVTGVVVGLFFVTIASCADCQWVYQYNGMNGTWGYVWVCK